MKFASEYNFYNPTKFYNGYGCLNKIGDLTKDLGSNFLLVTGKSSMKKSGFTDQVINVLEANGKKVFLYDNIDPNPTTDMIDNGAIFAVENNCEVVIGLGGGSAMDSAKGIAVVAGCGGKIWDYTAGRVAGKATLPIIAIPSTAGTGSEANRYLVITNKNEKFKNGLASDYTYPAISILDSMLTENLSLDVTMDTGIDALGHSIEAYVSKIDNSYGEIMALNSIKLIFQYLPCVLKDRKDIKARSAMMLAAMMGGVAIDLCGAGAPHAIAMTLGGLYEVTHGRAVGIILPYALERASGLIEEKLNILADFTGISKSKDQSNNSKAFVEFLKRFAFDIGIPEKLYGIGIKKDNIPEITEKCTGCEDFDTDPASYSSNEIKEFLGKII
jgi:alcohol dehydrogenase